MLKYYQETTRDFPCLGVNASIKVTMYWIHDSKIFENGIKKNHISLVSCVRILKAVQYIGLHIDYQKLSLFRGYNASIRVTMYWIHASKIFENGTQKNTSF